ADYGLEPPSVAPGLSAGCRRHREDIHAALRADLGKPEPETDPSEILPVTMEANHALRRLRRWMQPLISALAAGNRCVVKPSVLAPATSALIARIAAELFDPSEVAVVEGSAETAQELLGRPFDHVFFTGSERVGRLVMEDAAEHLSSVTLELGGKSPAIMDGTADIPRAADRIVWRKCVNAGQTCIAPHLLTGVSADSALMQEEIFGPILPVLAQRRRMATSRLVYPPYTKAKRRRIEWVLRLFG
ncbi:MAG: aldehyde dehydrogenase family protein, partial [Spirochaetaceae bacterium]